MRNLDNINIFNALINVLFIVGIAMYIFIKMGLFSSISMIMNHGNDFICGYIFSYLVSLLYKQFLNERLDNLILLILIIIASIYWELIHPAINKSSVSDFYDVIAYILGFIMYALINNFTVLKDHNSLNLGEKTNEKNN